MSGLRERICTVEGCAEPHRSKGLCKLHYERHLKGRILEEPRFYVSTDGPCLVNGCAQPRRSRGLCNSHYNKALRRAECPVCSESRQKTSVLCVSCYRAAAAAHLPTEKLCRGCDRALSLDAFGLRTSGGAARWRSRCKECECTEQRLRASLHSKTAPRDRSAERSSAPYLGLRRYAKKLGIPWAEVVER